MAIAASDPLFLDLFNAWLIFKHVIIPLPIGFLELIEMLIKPLKTEEQIKSKCGVSPLITQPRTTKPSYFLMFFEIITGISKVPETLIILIKEFSFFKVFNPFEI